MITRFKMLCYKIVNWLICKITSVIIILEHILLYLLDIDKEKIILYSRTSKKKKKLEKHR